MTTILFLVGALFVVGRVRWLLNEVGERIHQQMIAGLAIEMTRLRSLTPAGSAQTGDRSPQPSPVKAGVEARCPAPRLPRAPQSSAGAGADQPPTRPAPVEPHDVDPTIPGPTAGTVPQGPAWNSAGAAHTARSAAPAELRPAES